MGEKVPKVTKKEIMVSMSIATYKAIEAAGNEAVRTPAQEILFRLKQSFIGEVDARPTWERGAEGAAFRNGEAAE